MGCSKGSSEFVLIPAERAVASQRWETVAAVAGLGEAEAEVFSRDINSPTQLHRPRQQKPAFPACCFGCGTFLNICLLLIYELHSSLYVAQHVGNAATCHFYFLFF